MLKLSTILLSITLSLLTGCEATTDGLKRVSGELLPVRLQASPISEKSKASTVLIAHGSGGVSNGNRLLAKELNKWGYNSVIVDHYLLRGISVHTGVALHGVRGEDRALDAIEAARWVQSQNWHQGKIALVGFSQGGAGVLSLIDERAMKNLGYISGSSPNPISVAAAFYPACAMSSVPTNPAMPTQIHLAEKDDLAFISSCHFHANHTYEIHTYKNATHSFDENIPASVRLKFTHRYDDLVTDQSRRNLKEFLAKNMK